jgi:alpha-amylase
LDAAKHIEPDFCREVLKVVPPDKFVYGEVIGQTIEESNEYTRIFSVTDLHLLNTMSNAFSVGGGTKQRGGIQLGPRDVLFFVQTSTTECK